MANFDIKKYHFQEQREIIANRACFLAITASTMQRVIPMEMNKFIFKYKSVYDKCEKIVENCKYDFYRFSQQWKIRGTNSHLVSVEIRHYNELILQPEERWPDMMGCSETFSKVRKMFYDFFHDATEMSFADTLAFCAVNNIATSMLATHSTSIDGCYVIEDDCRWGKYDKSNKVVAILFKNQKTLAVFRVSKATRYQRFMSGLLDKLGSFFRAKDMSNLNYRSEDIAKNYVIINF